jgi:2,4-dienoyl-CoA reductase-like NADH-dependent reductase (Old Yellow Enzyme family)
MSTLFEPLALRDVTVRNRIVTSPMCQYSSEDGFATDWHLVHLGSRAVGGAGIVFTEAAAVEPRGRISQLDLGIWKDEHVEMLARVNRFVEAQGSCAALQLAHAGRKGSVGPPWDRVRGWVEPANGGWVPVAPTAEKDMPHYPVPHALERSEIAEMVRAFADAARRADAAGFAIVEIHAAHGYLLHEFLSPLSNQRTDDYGSSYENRIRFLLETTDAVRATWPERKPLFLRLSAVDWYDGGWSIEDSVDLARRLRAHGVDVIDVTSAGIGRSPLESAAQAPLYQVPFSERIRNDAKVKTMAVGLINNGKDAESVIAQGRADLVAIGRKTLGDPYFPYRAAHEIGADLAWPRQYRRALV